MEFRIKGKAKHTRNKNIKAFKKRVARNLGLKEHQINLTGAGEGSVILVFQIPHTAVSILRQAVEAKADWLMEAEVLGVHIEGEPCRQVMADKPKGKGSFLVALMGLDGLGMDLTIGYCIEFLSNKFCLPE